MLQLRQGYRRILFWQNLPLRKLQESCVLYLQREDLRSTNREPSDCRKAVQKTFGYLIGGKEMSDANELKEAVEKEERISEGAIRFSQMENVVAFNFWEMGKIIYVLETEGANIKLIREKYKWKTSYERCLEFKRLFVDYLNENQDREQLLLEATEPPKEIQDLGPDKLMELLAIRKEHRDEFVKSLEVPLNEATIKQIREKRREFAAKIKVDVLPYKTNRALKVFDEFESSLQGAFGLSEIIVTELREEFSNYQRRDKLKELFDKIGKVF